MGCYPPLAKFVSRALGKCNGRGERWRERRLDMDYAMAYPPGQPMQTHYMRPVARMVTFANNNNVFVIPPHKTPPPSSPPPQQQQQREQKQSTPEPPEQQQAPPQQQAEHHDHDTPPHPQSQPDPEPPAPEQEKAPDPAPPPAEPKPPKAPKRGKNRKAGGRVRFGPEPPPPQEQQHAPEPGNGGDTPGRHGPPQAGHQPSLPAYLFRYTPSPLPRWEATPRRHEYFSGEYRSYYPTPVREGIYRIATDANRLTTIFSEENPNACAIV